MSSKKTKYLNMHDWIGTDPWRRSEISENFQKLDDKALKLDDSMASATATAGQAKATAEGIDAKAESALSNSASAVTSANTAVQKASAADTKATAAKTTAEDALTKAQSADATAASVQNQFDQVVINGDSSIEAAQARVDTNGQTYTTLKQRLDSEHQSTTSLLAETAKYINIKKYGAVGDGITDDTQAIKNAILDAKVGDVLYGGSCAAFYRITDTITINKNIHVTFVGDIKYAGTRDKTALHFDSLASMKININQVKDISDNWHGWASDAYIGIVLRNLKDCDVDITNVENFTIGVRPLADGWGFWFNRTKINQLRNNRIQLDLCTKENAGWMNANYFSDTSFLYSESNTPFQTTVTNRICINQTLINSNYGGNTNLFTNYRFENHGVFGGTYTAIKLYRAHGYKFDNYRNELQWLGTKFCLLDVGLTQAADQLFSISGLSLNPLYVIGGAINAVEVLNSDMGKRSYSEIYRFTNETGKHTLFEELDFNKKYRFVSSNRHVIRNILRKSLSSTDLTETMSDYGTGDMSLVNGVNISSSYPIVFYITNLSKGDEILVKLEKSDEAKNPGMSFKTWDKNNIFCAGGLIGSTRAISHGGYWNETTKNEIPTVQGSNHLLTINHNDVGTLAVLLNGGIKSVRIYSSSVKNITKRTNIPKIEKLDGYISDVIPTKLTDGYFKPEDIVYHYDGTNVVQYKLTHSAGVNSWVNQGTINL